MGLFGGIKSALFGGGAAKGYQSKNTRQYETDIASAVKNRNATKAVGAGTQGYDFSGLDKANAAFKDPAKFSQTYKGSKFNFASTPQSAYNAQYELGAGDVRRENAGAMEQAREQIGPRRTGLLLKNTEGNQRNMIETLAKMRGGLGVEAAKEQSQLAKEQQLANAAEAYRGYQSRSDLEGRNADEMYRYRASLADAERSRIGLESDVTERERAYRDQALNYLNNLYSQGAAQSQANATLKNQARGQDLAFMGDIAQGAGAYFGGKKKA